MAPSKKISKAAQLKNLYRRRSNIFNSAELIQTFNNEYVLDQANQLSIRIAHLDELWRDFQMVQDQIEDLEDPEEEFCEDRREFQNRYFVLKASLTSKVPPSPSLSTPPPPPVNPPPPPSMPNLRLPEIKLKEFSGNFDEWESFSDLFVSLIDSNQQLTMVQKLYYLRASVTGEAARMISSLDLTATNYKVAWNLLRNRFENKNMLIKRHMAGLLSISPLKKESPSALLDLADEFNRHVLLLDKLEDEEDHWNSFLVERLSSCFDPITLREWETQSTGDDRPTYDQMLEFIQKRSRILQTLQFSQTSSSSQMESKSRPRVSTTHMGSSSTERCVCCQQPHPLFLCDTFKTVTPHERFDLVKMHGLCINCLKGSHLAKDCSSGACKTCARKHHTLLHLPPLTSFPVGPSDHQSQPVQQSSFAESNRSASQLSQIGSVDMISSRSVELRNASPLVSSVRTLSSTLGYTPPTSSVVPSDSHPPPNACQSAETSQNHATVLLSTAVIKVRGADNKFQLARALLDSGSQPSFISEALCQRLALNRTNINSPVSGIGQSTVTVRHKVSLPIASRFGDFEASLDCLILPNLTVALPSHHIDVTRWRIPRYLPLADPHFNVSQGVDVIIGAELFFTLLEQKQISLAVGYPFLQKTVLGYVVCGKIPEKVTCQVALSSHFCGNSLDSQLERPAVDGNLQKEHCKLLEENKLGHLEVDSRAMNGSLRPQYYRREERGRWEKGVGRSVRRVDSVSNGEGRVRRSRRRSLRRSSCRLSPRPYQRNLRQRDHVRRSRPRAPTILAKEVPVPVVAERRVAISLFGQQNQVSSQASSRSPNRISATSNSDAWITCRVRASSEESPDPLNTGPSPFGSTQEEDSLAPIAFGAYRQYHRRKGCPRSSGYRKGNNKVVQVCGQGEADPPHRPWSLVETKRFNGGRHVWEDE